MSASSVTKRLANRKRKVFVSPDGKEFRVGTIVRSLTGFGPKGLVLRIFASRPGQEHMGPTAWVAWDVPSRLRRYSVTHPSQEGRWASEAAEASAQKHKGEVDVEFTRIDYLTPVGQAKRVPKIVFHDGKPSALDTRVTAHWVGGR
jgi:hypothetical protein